MKLGGVGVYFLSKAHTLQARAAQLWWEDDNEDKEETKNWTGTP